MSVVTKGRIRQRADLTYKFNMTSGRHGWLRLTPAYSVKVVEELIARLDDPLRVLDPFCGTATTALCAAYHGHEGVTTDINPFLVWFGQVKTAHYSDATIASTRRACAHVLEAVKRGTVEPVKPPPIHNITRWWCSDALQFLCALKGGIERESEEDSAERDLLMVAFCRTLIKLSNAAFNHQSMSYKEDRQLTIPFDVDVSGVFAEDTRFVLRGAEANPRGVASVSFGDARCLSDAVADPFDLVITSPPYANRMSYIRELRPYMYWLGFLDCGRDAGELDWSAIGGTWGVATSRLTDWERSTESLVPPLLEVALSGIAHSANKNGKILANYVARYFEDLWKHFNSLITVLSDGGELHYIVGNSTFYGVLLPVERIYAAMLEQLGFEDIKYQIIRKRNSKKELFEFDVSARWSGPKSGTWPRATKNAPTSMGED
ncbi:DNA methyltransferase [Candidatus Palauibacter irciniicola]|uniref:DNA methyltransferase n=1 Tax=Candidatus Palauibacter irciniicola TaxID=3056733 RepID=UPI003B01C4D9